MKLIRFLAFAVAAAIGFFAVHSVSAAVFQAAQENQPNLAISNPTNDDLYTAGDRIEITGSVADDLFAAGRSLSVRGPVGQDVYLAGQMVVVESSVGDDLHAAGEAVTITNSVAGDVFLAGQNVLMSDTSTIQGDLYVGGAFITIDGIVEGDVRAAGSVSIGPRAHIHGNLHVANDTAPEIAEGAQISGEVNHTRPEPSVATQRTRNKVGAWVREILSLFILATILIYAWPSFVRAIHTHIRSKPWVHIGFGAVWAVALMPVILIFLISTIGIPLAFLTLFASVVLYMIAAGLVALFAGQSIMHRLFRTAQQSPGWVIALAGAIIYETVQLIPVIGWMITFAFVLMMVGGILAQLKPKIK